MAKAKVDESFAEENEEVAGASFGNDNEGLVVNLNEVEALSFDPIPKADYEVIVKENTFGMSKASDQPKWELQLVVTSGDYEGRYLFDTLSFAKGALPGTKSKLLVLAPELLSNESGFDIKNPEVVNSLVGRKYKARVSIQKGTDEYPDDRNNVKKYFPLEGAAAFA